MSKQQTILVVDDEATLREVVRRYLERETFRVIEADSGVAALRLLREERPDLIVLDVMLPGLDGFALARRLRDPADRGVILVEGSVPIVMLTARSEEADRLAGFELGADDYVVKPFSPRELVMRIKAVLRRAAPDVPQSAQPLTMGDLTLDPTAHTARRGSVEIALTAKEFELLWFLVNHPHQVFTRAQLLDRVWDYDYYGDESTVTVHIRRLREKIEPDPGAPIYLQTVWGVGYKFEGPV
ncbi:MAG TPA: response regulator transcription factor [Aggregatilinea sp.]|uniref:response regulator transcription factor n=1 Tax=Aggregatilinea sp. TaxID=2806333 RepID=UPI002CE78DD4|nr:response regulator transcription factor [Aggregatilinea sp.]HML20753.1 response regulator transcription factor [Aggregatilinea sp.]